MHGINCKVQGCTTGKRLLRKHIISGSVVPLWGAIEKAVNKYRASNALQRFSIVRAVESTNDGASASASSSSTSAAEGRQCVGIEIEERMIEQVKRQKAENQSFKTQTPFTLEKSSRVVI